MYPYKYKISLRVEHSSLDLSDVYEQLGQIKRVVPEKIVNIGESKNNKSWCVFGFNNQA